MISLLSLCVIVWKLSLLGSDHPMSFSAATRKLANFVFNILSVIVHFVIFTKNHVIYTLKFRTTKRKENVTVDLSL